MALGAMVIALGALPALAQSATLFAAAQYFDAGNIVIGETYFSVFAIGDFDGDGMLDIVATNASNARVSIVFGRPEATFTPSVQLATGTEPVSVVVGDFNSDGKLDIATANHQGNCVSVLIGHGDGTFNPHADYPAGNAPLQLAMEDMNEDGNLDLMAVNSGSGSVSVLLGRGDGTFAAAIDYPVTGNPTSLAVGDLNGDRKPDLVCADPATSIVSVRMGLGDGTFGPGTDHTLPDRPLQVVLSDLNGDGRLDLLVAHGWEDGAVSVLLGEGDGTFAAETRVAIGVYLQSISVADINCDGTPDLIAASFDRFGTGEFAAEFSLGLGDGTFGPNVSYEGAGGAVAARDLNADGKPELVTAGGGLTVFTNKGDGTFLARTDIRTEYPVALAVGDVNGDNLSDLVVTDLLGGTNILLGRADGTYPGDYSSDAVIASGNNSTPAVIGDVNSDGIGDILVGNPSDPLVHIAIGRSGGAPTEIAGLTLTHPAQCLALGDFNEDGKLDLVTADAGLSSVSVWFGNGDGTFHAGPQLSTGVSPSFIAIADLDHDGHADLAVANQGDGSVSVLLGHGDGTFAARSDCVVGTGPVGIAVVDLNGDGAPDLVSANLTAGSLSVLIGHGDGMFAPAVNYPVGRDAYSVTAADVDQDGHPDLITTNGGLVMVFMGRGDGTIGQAHDYVTGNQPRWVAAADLNADGRPDLLAANWGGLVFGSISEFFNIGGSTGPPTAVDVSLVSADSAPGVARLTWYTAARGITATVYRRTASTDWSALGTEAADGSGFIKYEDRPLASGGRFGYRLGISDAGAQSFVGETWVQVPAGAGLALSGMTPNPAVRELSVSFSLPDDSPASLELMDLAGRRVRSIEVGSRGAGRHVVSLGSAGSLPAGVYLVRLHHAQRTLVAKAVVMR